MKINDSTQNKVRFDKLLTGYTFFYEEELYIRVRPFDCNESEYNAVCLTDGNIYKFQWTAEVVPCIAEVEVVKRGVFA